jgi:hypothetical protein
VTVQAGYLARPRAAYRRSARMLSTSIGTHTARASSRARVTEPSCFRARVRASSVGTPLASSASQTIASCAGAGAVIIRRTGVRRWLCEILGAWLVG